MMKIKDLVSKVQAWGDDKKITSPENVDKQYMKFIEEVLEFKTEMDLRAYIEKNGLYSDDGAFTITDALGADKEKVEKALKLEMGDILVTLIIMAKQKGYDFVKMYQESQSKHFVVSSGERFLLLMEKAIDLGKHGLQVNFVEVLTVLQIIAYWNNLYFEECLSMAYGKIKDRKGVTRDGKFIKEGRPMRATYGMRLRPFSPGTFPKRGFVEVVEDTSKIPVDLRTKYYDFLVYDRELSNYEMKAWELDFLWIEREDQKWQRTSRAYLIIRPTMLYQTGPTLWAFLKRY